MKFIIQNVLNASVSVDQKIVGQINQGYVVFIGISNDDNEETANKMIQKMLICEFFKMKTVKPIYH